ncbi:hypothetical protein [Pedobacter heparinus]|nr:hypothetical protein [Pedobacter heparinus]
MSKIKYTDSFSQTGYFNYQAQFQKVKDIKAEIEFLEIQETNEQIKDSDINEIMS